VWMRISGRPDATRCDAGAAKLMAQGGPGNAQLAVVPDTSVLELEANGHGYAGRATSQTAVIMAIAPAKVAAVHGSPRAMPRPAPTTAQNCAENRTELSRTIERVSGRPLGTFS
jgi:hypothetical protein